MDILKGIDLSEIYATYTIFIAVIDFKKQN